MDSRFHHPDAPIPVRPERSEAESKDARMFRRSSRGSLGVYGFPPPLPRGHAFAGMTRKGPSRELTSGASAGMAGAERSRPTCARAGRRAGADRETRASADPRSRLPRPPVAARAGGQVPRVAADVRPTGWTSRRTRTRSRAWRRTPVGIEVRRQGVALGPAHGSGGPPRPPVPATAGDSARPSWSSTMFPGRGAWKIPGRRGCKTAGFRARCLPVSLFRGVRNFFARGGVPR